MEKKKKKISVLTVEEGTKFKTHGNAKIGKKHKMPYLEYCRFVLETNATLPASKKMTDPMLCKLIATEYSKHDSIADKFKLTNPDAPRNMIYLRLDYNNGKLVTRKGPPKTAELVSFQYDEKGFILDPRYADPTHMSVETIKKRIETVMKRRKKWEEKHVKNLKDQQQMK